MKLLATIGVLTAMRLLASALTQFFVLSTLGVGTVSDALVASSLLPQLATTLLIAPAMQVLVPVFSALPAAQLKPSIWSTFVVVCAASASMVVVLVFLADKWVPLVVPGFTDSGRELGIRLTQIQLLSLAASMPFSVLWAGYCAGQRLLLAEGVQTATLLLSSALIVNGALRFDVTAIVVAMVLRPVFDVLILTLFLGGAYKFLQRQVMLRATWLRLRNLLLGSAVYGTEPLVNQILASFAPAGSLSALFSGIQLYALMGQLSYRSLAAPISPVLAQHAQHANWTEFGLLYRRRLWLSLALSIAVLAAIALFGEQMLASMIEHTRLTRSAMNLIVATLMQLFGMCLAANAGHITLGALNAMGDTRSPTLLGILSYVVYLPVKFVSFAIAGLLGLALATSVFQIVNLTGQALMVERKISRRQAVAAP